MARGRGWGSQDGRGRVRGARPAQSDQTGRRTPATGHRRTPHTHTCVRTVRRQRRVRARATKRAQNQTSDAQSQMRHTHRVAGGPTNRVKSGVRSGPAAPAHPGPRRVPAVNQTDAQTGTRPHHRHTRQVGKEKPTVGKRGRTGRWGPQVGKRAHSQLPTAGHA